MVTFLLLIGLYLCVVVTFCLITFYYKDVDGDRIIEGNTLGEFLHFRGEDSAPFLVYFPGVNVFFFLVLVIIVLVDLLLKLSKRYGIGLDLSSRVERILNTRIRK